MGLPTDKVWVGCHWLPLTERMDLSHFGQYDAFPNPGISYGPVRGHILAMTLIHEFIEAVADIYDLKIKETEIRCLETSLVGVIMRSPELTDWVVRELRKSESLVKPDVSHTIQA